MEKTTFDILQPLFIIPEKTKAGYSFADTPIKISFNESNVVFYGVPLEFSTSFGKGASRGPEAIRLTSALQVETFLLDENIDIYDRVKIYDLGDIILPSVLSEKNKNDMNSKLLAFLDKTLPKITSSICSSNKVPVMMGGEHTFSYYTIKAVAKDQPLLIHFDAHRDMKPEYFGMKLCHTTPFYHLMNEGHIPGGDIIQIGIRQTDEAENKIAKDNEVITFDAWLVHNKIERLLKFLKEVTRGRKIYMSFDIDVYDLPFVSCTGTPEPFGLNPFEVVQILKSISPSARLVGLDITEVAVKNDDYREGTLATQTLLRILSRDYAMPNF